MLLVRWGLGMARFQISVAIGVGTIFARLDLLILRSVVAGALVVRKHAVSEVSLSDLLLGLSAIEDTLGPLPCFNTTNEENGFDDDNSPLPSDAGVLENHMVDDWDVEGWEDSDKTSDDRPEEELVAPDIVCPLGEVLLTTRLHSEEGTSHID